MARKSRKGFASLDLERQQEVARRGGQTGQHLGKGHTFIHEEARRVAKEVYLSLCLGVHTVFAHYWNT